MMGRKHVDDGERMIKDTGMPRKVATAHGAITLKDEVTTFVPAMGDILNVYVTDNTLSCFRWESWLDITISQ